MQSLPNVIEKEPIAVPYKKKPEKKNQNNHRKEDTTRGLPGKISAGGSQRK
jgi:hypothetical protein